MSEEKEMTWGEAVKEGLIDPFDSQGYEWEMKHNALARFTSAELMRELRERANRKVIEMRLKPHPRRKER
jgi:hypothetical protein